MSDDSMVERVARAIDPEVFALPRINLYGDRYRKAFERASAAIEAMRTPTEAMIERGATALCGEYDLLPERATYIERKSALPHQHWDDRAEVREELGVTYAAMISAALEPKP